MYCASGILILHIIDTSSMISKYIIKNEKWKRKEKETKNMHNENK
jgi:hypothetical protein